jgi:hypothetical protein
MALELKLSLCFKEKCSKLQISDATGEYDVTTNPTGWGAPNLALADVDSATVVLTPPGGSAINYDVTAEVQGGTIVDGTFLLKLVDNITLNDGIYTVTYTVVDEDTDTEYTITVKSFSTCKADCCVEKMKTKFKGELCGCNWENFWDYYKQAEALLYAGKDAQATDLLTQVNKICSIQKCCC